MRKLTVIIFACLSVLICKSQQSVNNLNTNVKDLVFIQFLNNLEVNYSFVIAAPGFFAMANVQQSNIDVLFDKDSPDLDKLVGNSGLNRQEFLSSLNIEFIPVFKSDTTIQMQAKMKNKLLYTTKLTRKGNTETYKIALPDESFSKEITFQNGQFNSLTLVKPDERYWIINEKKTDSLYCQTTFNTKSASYTFTDDFYQNNKLTRKVLYKNTSDRKSREIKKTWNYNYDSDGKINLITGIDNQGTKTDSANYFYTGSKLNSVVTHNKDSQSTTFYHPETGLMIDYRYKDSENNINIHYEYNQHGQIANVLLKNSKKPAEESYNFEYNSSDKLVSIKKYVTSNISNDLVFKNQYLFSYNKDQILTSMIVSDKKGNIQKEISYDINYLN